MIAMAVLLAGCAGPRVSQHSGRAPDAVLGAMGEPADHRVWAVVRPTVWVEATGGQIVDDRITMAVLNRDTATWQVASRLNDLQALSLIDALQQAVQRRSAANPTSVVLVESQEIPADLGPNGVVSVAGGAWQVTPTEGALIRLDLVDETGHAHVRVVTDILSAQDLGRRLGLIVRVAG